MMPIVMVKTMKKNCIQECRAREIKPGEKILNNSLPDSVT
jgi:hypothetical protein